MPQSKPRPKPPRAFIHLEDEPAQPVDKLRFAVVNEERSAVLSAVWTVSPSTNQQKSDFYVTATGFQGSAKFSFHRDILNHSVLTEAHSDLIDRGVLQPGSRHWQQLPIPGLPWHGLTVRLAPGLLSKKGHSLDQFEGTIVALPPPREGRVLEVGFLLAEGEGLNINGAQFCIGQVVSGGRALVIAGRYAEHDTDKLVREMKELVLRTPIPSHVAEEASPDTEYAMHLFGIDGGAMTVTEVHNVRLVPPAATEA